MSVVKLAEIGRTFVGNLTSRKGQVMTRKSRVFYDTGSFQFSHIVSYLLVTEVQRMISYAMRQHQEDLTFPPMMTEDLGHDFAKMTEPT